MEKLHKRFEFYIGRISQQCTHKPLPKIYCNSRLILLYLEIADTGEEVIVVLKIGLEDICILLTYNIRNSNKQVI